MSADQDEPRYSNYAAAFALLGAMIFFFVIAGIAALVLNRP